MTDPRSTAAADAVRDTANEDDIKIASLPVVRPGAAVEAAPKRKILDFALPNAVGHYHILERLGSGTCGVVCRGYDPHRSRDVAIKLSPARQREGKRRYPGAYRAFINEAAVAGRLRHRHIVRLYDAGVAGDLNYLVMEYLPGGTLRRYGKRGHRMPTEKALSVVIDCLGALQYAHEQGVLHRDVKPSNILLDPGGAPKLVDFGIAILVEHVELAQRKTPLGTPNYMAPEQVRGETLSAATDVYAMASVLYELLTGQALFAAPKLPQLFQLVQDAPPPPLRQQRPDLPEALEKVLLRALHKQVEHRYAQARDFAQALHAAMSGASHASALAHEHSNARTDASVDTLPLSRSAQSIKSMESGRRAIPESERSAKDLSSLALFAQWPRSALHALYEHGHWQRTAVGDAVVWPSAGIVIFCQGAVQLLREQRTVQVLVPGDALCLEALSADIAAQVLRPTLWLHIKTSLSMLDAAQRQGLLLAIARQWTERSLAGKVAIDIPLDPVSRA